ncbi:MAG: hypothetical protein AB8E15_04340 [Bdellovibrionales bacterium]
MILKTISQRFLEISLCCAISFLLFIQNAHAQKILIEEASNKKNNPAWEDRAKNIKSGRKAASKYMNRKVANVFGSARYLAVHAGTFISDEAYRWGQESSFENKGKMNLGVTYRMGEWTNSMDLFLRSDLLSYDVDGETPYKISIMPMISFPDSKAEFPLYFGAGIGGGIFFKQTSGESSLSLDYNLMAGIRFYDLFENMGLLIETGLKGHVHLLSDGQFNGTYITTGLAFNF